MSETNPVGNRVIHEYYAGARASLLPHNPYNKTCQCSTQRRVCKCGHVYFVTACQSQPFCLQCSKPLHDYSQDGNLDEEMAHLDAAEMIPDEKQQAAKLLSSGPLCGDEPATERKIFPDPHNRLEYTVLVEDAMKHLRFALDSLDSIPQDGSDCINGVNHLRWSIARDLTGLLQHHGYCAGIGGKELSNDVRDFINGI